MNRKGVVLKVFKVSKEQIADLEEDLVAEEAVIETVSSVLLEIQLQYSSNKYPFSVGNGQNFGGDRFEEGQGGNNRFGGGFEGRGGRDRDCKPIF